MSVSICLLAYKEEENLKFLLPKIISNIEKVDNDYEILIIDAEKSLDKTKEVCSNYKNCKYYNQIYPYFGGAMRTGIKYASKDYFLILDADGSHNPSYIPDLVNRIKITNCDVVIGSRYIKGGVNEDKKINIFMSKILNLCFRFTLGIKAKDISTDYRIYQTKQLKEIELKSNYYNIVQEILIKLKVKNENFHIEEVPITFKKRYYGNSKRNLSKFLIEYIKHLFSFYFYRLKNEKKYFANVINVIVCFGIFTLMFFTLINNKNILLFHSVTISTFISYLFGCLIKLLFIRDIKPNYKRFIIKNLITLFLISSINGLTSYLLPTSLHIGFIYLIISISSIVLLILTQLIISFLIKLLNHKIKI